MDGLNWGTKIKKDPQILAWSIYVFFFFGETNICFFLDSVINILFVSTYYIIMKNKFNRGPFFKNFLRAKKYILKILDTFNRP